jgi:hypothetical protein
MYTYISCQIIKTSTLKTVRTVRPKQMDGRTRVNNIEFGTFCLVHFRNHKRWKKSVDIQPEALNTFNSKKLDKKIL